MARGDSFAGGCLGGVFGILLVSGLCIALCAGTAGKMGDAIREVNEKAAAEGKPSPFAPTPATEGLTMAKFLKVKTGMTGREVIAILGPKFQILAVNEFGGIKTELCQWDGFFLASCHITFQNGKVVQKAQFGLK